MKKHKFSRWMFAVRPWSFPASAMPVAVTLAYLFWRGMEIDWLSGVWAIINVVVFHAAGNVWSDYFDYRKGVDAEDTFGAKTMTSGEFTPREMLNLAIGLLSAALAMGVGLMLRAGLPLLWFGLAGALTVVLYPRLKYSALGDVDIMLAYALLPTLGTSFVATGCLQWEALWIALPVGLITVAILHSNNTRDIATDNRAKISTLAMNLGRNASKWLYAAEVLLPFAWVVGCAFAGVFPLWTLLTLPAVVPAWMGARDMLRHDEQSADTIANLDERTAKLQLMFSLLFTVSFIVASLV
ncbi:MAG: prenyltransferase [Bacteroidaceae bacterium]|nr:prenyltransferase [Bacteroidaceae bacterium]